MDPSAKLAADAFRLRRLDRLTIREAARQLGVCPKMVEKLAKRHEAAVGLSWMQQSCGAVAEQERRWKLVASLFLAGAKPVEIAEILDYTVWQVRRIVARSGLLPARQGRSLVSGGRETSLHVKYLATQLAGWQTGQAIVWSCESGAISLRPANELEAGNDERPTWDELVRMAACSGLDRDRLLKYQNAYRGYVIDQRPIKEIAQAFGWPDTSVADYAEQFARICGLGWRSRRPQHMRTGQVHVNRRGTVQLLQSVHLLRWSPGTDLLWRVNGRRITIERFDLTTVRQSLGI